MLKPEQILAALKTTGPISPGTLADRLEVSKSALDYHLKRMIEAGTVKAAGVTKSRRVALPDQKFDAAEAPPQEHKRSKKKKHKGKTRKARAAKPTPAPRGDFTPAITADLRLVLIDGTQPAQIFQEEQTTAIAELLFQHFRA